MFDKSKNDFIIAQNLALKRGVNSGITSLMSLLAWGTALAASLPYAAVAGTTVNKSKHTRPETITHTADHNSPRPASRITNGSKQSESITVAHKRLNEVDTARRHVDDIPGAGFVIDAKSVLKGRNLTNADALSFQPGVTAQSSGGGDGLRLSIRGSGIQTGTNYFRSGILMMFDGLPITQPGGTPYELFEPLGVQYTEVLIGGNAFDLGGLQLGGAINYETQTGYGAQKYQARVEAGSFGYVKEQLSSGHVIGKSDYYISLTNSYRAGYQENTKATSFGVNFNYGYKFNDAVSTRFFFRYRQTANGYPGYLTRDQILSNPKQDQSGYTQTYRIQPGTKYIGNMTTIRLDDQSTLKIGANYQNAPIDIQEGATASLWNYQTVGAVVTYDRKDKFFNRNSDFRLGILSYTDLDAWQKNKIRIPTGTYASGLPFYGSSYAPNVVPFGTTIRRVNYGGTENYFYARENYELFKNFFLTGAGAIAFIKKSSSVPYPENPAGSNKDYTSVNFIPRGGFRYVIKPNITVYGNVSRSIQPPNDWNINNVGPYFPTNTVQDGLNAGAGKLRNQTATTFEIGTRGSAWHNSWSLSYYHSRVHNELLSVMTPESEALGTSIYTNSESPTTHQGVEFSLQTEILKWNGNTLSLRQAYTWEDFHYDHNSVFGNNRLPGIPEHFYQGEIHLDTKSGFYAGFSSNVSSKVSGSYDDTYYAPSYHIFNVTAGYDWPGKHRQVFLSLNNLANKHYASITVPGYQAAGKQLAVFQPGDGFGIFGGISVGFD